MANPARSIDLISKFNKIILPYVKQAFGKRGSIWLPELAANLCLLSTIGGAANESSQFDDLFKFFGEMICVNIEWVFLSKCLYLFIYLIQLIQFFISETI